MKLLSVLTILILCVTYSCTKNIQTDHQAKVDSIIKIELISNPTTGYSWKWTNKESITILDSIGFRFLPNSNLTGSGGVEIWKFKCKKKGTEVIKFNYNRSWEPNSTVEQREISITVK